jgi:non-canonical poly(A) RNA polymerase PAPD5/7
VSKLGPYDKTRLQARQEAITAAVDTFKHFFGLSPNPEFSIALDDAPKSRKRTHDGQVKLPPVTSLKKAPRMRSAGFVEQKWRAVKGEPATPWHIIDHSAESTSAVMSVTSFSPYRLSLRTVLLELTKCLRRLHKEIVDFYEHFKPRDFEDRIRQGLVDDLRKKIRAAWRDATVFSFGSFRSGLYLPNADMDLVLCSDQYMKNGIPKYNLKNSLWRFKAFLQQNGCALDNDDIEVIVKAKVPLVKYIEQATGLKMDISFEKLDGVNAVQTFEKWKRQFPAMPTLVTLVKQFLQMRGLHEPVNGGIGGFSIICLVVSMLQHNPRVQSRSMVPEHHLGELLLEFFDLYGNRLNCDEVAVQMNPPAYVNKVSDYHRLIVFVFSLLCHSLARISDDCFVLSSMARTSCAIMPMTESRSSIRTIRRMTLQAAQAIRWRSRRLSGKRTKPCKTAWSRSCGSPGCEARASSSAY